MERVNFEVDSALLSELGERLVGSVQVALMELVKNSYDADATEVTISINHVAGGVETRIDDNGVGMTFEQVKKYWMRIATTNKVENNTSAIYGRPKSGAKGIGRFSCRRLGSKLRLRTTAKTKNGGFETTEFVVDWTMFKPGTELSRISVYCERTVSKTGTAGTSLTITSHDKALFNKRNLDYIKRSSALLVANRGITRRGYVRDPGFDLSFKFFEGDETHPHNLRDDIFNAGWGVVTGVVEEDGAAKLVLDAMGIGTVKYISAVKFPMIKGAKLRIGALVDDSSQLRDKSVLSIGIMREILSEWGGVFVRFNGVRIEPYGDKNDDWLNIDRDRGLRHGVSVYDDIVRIAKALKEVQPNRFLLSLLSSRSYVGDVDITTRHKGLELKASREGFLRTEAFEQLQNFSRMAVDFITLYRDKFIKEKAEEALRQKESDFKKLVFVTNAGGDNQDMAPSVKDTGLQAIAFIRHLTKSIPSVISDDKVKEVIHDIYQATDYLEQRERNTDEELRRLRLVASGSVLLSLFSHDVKAYLVKMENVEIALGKISEKENNLKSKDRIGGVIKEIREHRKAFQRLIDMTLAVSAPSTLQHAEKLLVKDRLEMVVACFKTVMMDYGIVCDISGVPDDLYVGPLLVSELYSIFINVISNGIKAVVAKCETGNRRIQIVGTKIGRHSRFSIRDNGIGVNLSESHKLFEPYISDPGKVLYPALDGNINKEHAFVLGTGSGLGLSIIRQIVESRNGTIEFITPLNGWSTELRIEI